MKFAQGKHPNSRGNAKGKRYRPEESSVVSGQEKDRAAGRAKPGASAEERMKNATSLLKGLRKK